MKKEIVFLLILVIPTNSYHSYTASGTLLLYGGGTNYGILQIYHNGRWKSICADEWNIEESTVACRQLGFINYVSYSSSRTYFGYWLDDVVCTGNEQKIINCQNNGWGNYNCEPSEAIYLKCRGPLIINPTTACIGEQITVNCTLNVPHANDDFFSNLTNFIVGDSDVPISQFSVEGRGFHGGVDLSKLTATAIGGTTKSVEGTITLISYTPADNGTRLGCSNDYYINGNTSNRGTVSESTTIQQALPPSTPFVYISLSYLSPDNYSAIISWSSLSDRVVDAGYIYRDGIFLAVTNNTQYTDTEHLIVDTQYSYSVIANSCAGNSTQGMKNITIDRDGTLRLYRGTSYGTLEIYHNGIWKSICDDGWNIEESTVACRQLGFVNYVSYSVSRTTYSSYWLDNVVCTGNEEKIINCRHSSWGFHNCRSSEGIYLKCTGGKVTIYPTTACIGEQITINCTLNVSNYNYNFFSILTNFIVGDSDVPISQFSVEGTGFHGGVDLSKLTATAIGGTTKSVEGTITLISYTPADNGIRLGCSNIYINGDTSYEEIVSESTTIQQALPPSTPTIDIVISYLSQNNYSILIIWLSPASDRNITYYIYRSDTLIAVTDNTEYTYTDQLLVNTIYSYSVIANSCAGNSSQGIKSITVERDDGSLRLYGGGTYNGKLLIYHNGIWGYICKDRWNREESLVACRQLGFIDYSYYYRAEIRSSFFWLDDVICNGTEEEIINCRNNGWGIHNCISSEGIYLSCKQAGTAMTEGPSSASITIVVGPIVGALCVPLTIIAIVAITCVVYCSRRKTARARAATHNLIGSTPTRTVRQIPETIPLRNLNTESTQTRDTVYDDNLGKNVIDLTFLDLPPAYEDL